MKFKFKRLTIWLLTLIVAGYLSACVFLYLKQDRILFPASKTAMDQKYSFPFPFEEVWIDSDGAKLHGLYFKAQDSKGLIVFFHGNTEKAEQFGATADEFTQQSFDYFIPDYRGYGKSTGKITNEKQFLSDIDRIYDWAKQRYPENKIAIGGRSLGAVPAAYLASKNHPRLTVMIAPFFNVAAMKGIRYPLLPDFLLKYEFPNNRWIAESKSPIYLIHGTEDKTIPYSHSERLATFAKAEHRYFTVPGAGHSNLQDFPLYHRILYLLMNEEVENSN